MSRSQQRQDAIHLCFATVAWVACVFFWLAILSFSVADPPSTSVFPTNNPPQNLCGSVGARFAHAAYYFLGYGAVALAALLTGAVFAWTRQVRLTDLWLRVLGLSLVCTVISSLATLFILPSDSHLVTGPGGVLGLATSAFLKSKLQLGGTLITLAAALIVGLLLAADQAVIHFARGAGTVGKKGGSAMMRASGAALGAAAGAVNQGFSRLGTRLAPAGADALGGSITRESSPATPTSSARVVAPKASVRPTISSLPPPIPGSRTTTAEAAPPKPAPLARQNELEFAARAEPSQSAAPAEFEMPSELDDDHDADAAPPDDSPAMRRGPEPIVAPQKPVDVKSPPKVTAVGGASPARLEPSGSVAARPPKVGDYELPSVTLLDEPDVSDKDAVESLCREKAYILENTLNEFRLEVQVVGIETGPVITVFELKLAPGVKVSQVASLNNDMARALKAPAVRVVAPLPGRNTIGIEVPNIDKEKVRLKDLLRGVGPRAEGYAIPLFLGKDASGQSLVADLAKMPHLLIAGTTGSGKSVCVSSIVMSILLMRTPEEVQLVMVDPKVVELAMFKDIPHLMCPIVTEISKAEAILDWAATKMDERYELLAEAGVKDIRSYNKLGRDGLRQRMQIETDEEMERIPIKLPYIVIVIDELADLMMTSAKEVEFYLCRLAQKSRAVGIHLIVSTQRPQANVVTGLIKSNMPSRIAFRVASRLDSRIVLDQNGGEVLMGQGDMLFLPPGQSKLVRAQGTYISDEELRAVVEHARKQGEPSYHPELIRMPKLGADGAEERDEFFDQAVDIMLETGRGSVSLLQRRLNVGYSRASRLIEQMYHAGIVGEYKGSQAREVTLTKEEWQQVKAQRDREMAAEAESEDR